MKEKFIFDVILMLKRTLSSLCLRKVLQLNIHRFHVFAESMARYGKQLFCFTFCLFSLISMVYNEAPKVVQFKNIKGLQADQFEDFISKKTVTAVYFLQKGEALSSVNFVSFVVWFFDAIFSPNKFFVSRLIVDRIFTHRARKSDNKCVEI